MSLFSSVSDIGIGVITNAGKTIVGGVKTAVGHLAEDPDMAQEGMETMGRGVTGMAKSMILRAAMNADDNEGADA